MKTLAALFIALAACVGPTTLTAQFGQWLYRQNRDAFTEVDQSLAMVMVVTDEQDTTMAGMDVSCDGKGGFAISVLLGFKMHGSASEYLGSPGASVPVRWKIDRGAVHVENWPVASTGKGITYPGDERALVREFKAGGSLLFEVTDYALTRHSVTFPLVGFARAYDQLPCVKKGGRP